MTATVLTNRAFRFKRFSRKGFSAFASLHREVTIGRLSAYITDLQLQKSGRSFLIGNRGLLALWNKGENEEREAATPTPTTPVVPLDLAPTPDDAALRSAAIPIYDSRRPSQTRSAVAFLIPQKGSGLETYRQTESKRKIYITQYYEETDLDLICIGAVARCGSPGHATTQHHERSEYHGRQAF